MKQIHQRESTNTSTSFLNIPSYMECLNEPCYQNKFQDIHHNFHFQDRNIGMNYTHDFNITLKYNLYHDYLHRSLSLDYLLCNSPDQKVNCVFDEYGCIDSPNDVSSPTSNYTGVIDNSSDLDINSIEFDNNNVEDRSNSHIMLENPSYVVSQETLNTCEFSKFKWMDQKVEDFDINKYDEPSQNSKGKRSGGASKQRKSHIDSERKRRKTINNAISYLAQRIPMPNGNQSKAKTLINAGHFIDVLLDENKRLKAELLNLYKILYC